MTIKTNGINQNKISDYFSIISSKHSLDMDSLIEDWNSAMSLKTDTDTETKDNSLSVASLKKLKKGELQEKCSELGHNTSGTKDQLICRIMGTEEPVSKPKSSTKTTVAKTKKVTDDSVEKTAVAKKLTAKTPVISIRRNQFGNHEHAETGFVFDKKTKKVIGKQKSNGKIEDLTPEDIDTCNQYKFDYELPDNLDKTGLDDVSVDELDEEEDDDEIIESEEEEELLEEDELLEEEEEDDEFEEEEEY